MPLFSGKPKVDMQPFCHDYYDSQLFHVLVDGTDATQKVLDFTYEGLLQSEPSFADIDRSLFEREMTAMHVEIFALAFFQRFLDFDKAVLHEILAARYITAKSRNDILEASAEYNLALAKTATMDKTGKPLTGAVGRMTITRVNDLRSLTLERLVPAYVPGYRAPTEQDRMVASCIVRVCNRIEADLLSKEQIGNRTLAGLFLSRLGTQDTLGRNWQPTEDFFWRIAALPRSAFDFATRALNAVDLHFPSLR